MQVNYLAIAVVMLFAILIFRGYRRGFLRILVYLIGMVGILLAVRACMPTVSEIVMNNTNIYSSVQQRINGSLLEMNSKNDNTLKENQTETINSYNMPSSIKNSLIENNTEDVYKNLLVEQFDDYVSAFLAKKAVSVMSFFVLFIFFWLIFKIVLMIVHIIERIPIIKGLNKMAGAVVGGMEALIIVWVAFSGIIFFLGYETGNEVMGMINDSPFLTVLYNANPFSNWF